MHVNTIVAQVAALPESQVRHGIYIRWVESLNDAGYRQHSAQYASLITGPAKIPYSVWALADALFCNPRITSSAERELWGMGLWPRISVAVQLDDPLRGREHYESLVHQLWSRTKSYSDADSLGRLGTGELYETDENGLVDRFLMLRTLLNDYSAEVCASILESRCRYAP